MPSVVAGALVSAVGLSGIAATVATAALGAVASMAVQATVARPKARPTSTGRRIEMVRSPNEARRVIYGEARVSGPLVFAHTINSAPGKTNHILGLAIPLAAHEVDSFGAVYVNDERLAGMAGAGGWVLPPSTSRYWAGANKDGVNVPHYLQWRVHAGTDSQVADTFLSSLTSTWTVNHRLRGVAYAAVRLNWNSEIWAAGLPNLSWEVKGRKLFDPRTGETRWSDNPALCIRDYLASSFGLGCGADEIDEASFIAAANLCDEIVPVAGGGEQKRYTCNGVFALDEKPMDVMERLLSSCGGTLVYSGGRYRLFPAAWRTPVLSLHAGLLRGPAIVRPRLPSRQQAEQVRGTFINPARGWQAADFPPVGLATGLAQDMELPFTTNAFAAQRLAALHLARVKSSLVVELPCTLAALDVAVMEPVRLTLEQTGWTEKTFVPLEWTLTPDGGIDLVLQEDDPSLYAWNGGTALAGDVPDVVLPGIYPDPPRLVLSDEVVDGALCLVVEVTEAEGGFVTRTEAEYRKQGTENWQALGVGERLVLSGVVAGATYEVRARSHNVLGLVSSWAEASRQVAGDSAPPGDIVSLAASLAEGVVYLDWLPPDAGLVQHYRLRWSPLVSGAGWAGAVDVSTALTNTRAAVPARIGTYFAKAVDVFGRESANAVAYVNVTPEARGSNVVASQSEHPGFAGAKTNCVVNGSGQLVIDSLTAFDAQAGNFDVLSGNFDSAGGGTSPSGVYEFATVVDLGAVYVVRASASVKTGVIDLASEVDAVAGDFDAREGVFDGTAPAAVDVAVEVSATNDNPSGAPTWGAWQRLSVGDYKGRGLRFRAVLTSRNLMATPAVEELAITLDMPDRMDAGANVSSSTSGTSLTFSPAFKATPAIAVTGTNLASGDYAVITSQSRTGFTVQFKNSAGTGISRSFDWVARGYGREQ